MAELLSVSETLQITDTKAGGGIGAIASPAVPVDVYSPAFVDSHFAYHEGMARLS